MAEQKIDTADHQPIRLPLRRLAFWRRDGIARQVKEILDRGVIIPCENSDWAFNIVLALKKDKTLRFYFNYKPLNEKTVTDLYLLPGIDDFLDVLKGSKYFTGLDLAMGFWQIRMHPD